MELKFFVPMIIPSATHQEKKIATRGKRVIVYEPPKVMAARAKYAAELARFVPKRQLKGPLWLTTKWIYKDSKTHPAETWKTTKPDTDNLVKMLKDVMTSLHFWKDDAEVACETIQKFYDIVPGLYVEIKEL
ncbi:RusA family crossover junction endodeoxyribonuclease [uncultured Megasphaera sp.]|uniref:RusA family crossover junction endodeoxyribonuclease n=1 Tax=uncultured Megasphaera sp. TaxID=165188 RepID=UPI002598CD85|nr:RusA family crossover junction endodeoxyribonuclease [uncultured Megasphaera sp.]